MKHIILPGAGGCLDGAGIRWRRFACIVDGHRVMGIGAGAGAGVCSCSPLRDQEEGREEPGKEAEDAEADKEKD